MNKWSFLKTPMFGGQCSCKLCMYVIIYEFISYAFVALSSPKMQNLSSFALSLITTISEFSFVMLFCYLFINLFQLTSLFVSICLGWNQSFILHHVHRTLISKVCVLNANWKRVTKWLVNINNWQHEHLQCQEIEPFAHVYIPWHIMFNDTIYI